VRILRIILLLVLSSIYIFASTGLNLVYHLCSHCEENTLSIQNLQKDNACKKYSCCSKKQESEHHQTIDNNGCCKEFSSFLKTTEHYIIETDKTTIKAINLFCSIPQWFSTILLKSDQTFPTYISPTYCCYKAPMPSSLCTWIC